MSGTVVESCPANSTEVVEASSRLNCGRDLYDNIQYVCAPNVEKTALVEFCYGGIMRPIPKGNCLEINNRAFVDSNCTGFVEGCPEKYYRGNAVYKHPACLRINTDYKCYLADPSCPNITQQFTTEDSWGSSTANGVYTPTTPTTAGVVTSYEISSTTEKGVYTTTPANGVPVAAIVVPIVGLVAVALVIIGIVIMCWKKRKKRTSKRDEEVGLLPHSTNIDANNRERRNLGNGDDGTESHDELVADESHDELVADESHDELVADVSESHDELVADVSESENLSSKVEDYARDPEFQKRFQQYLEEGSVDVCPISQIIIVGENGVGKTTLLYRLQGRSQGEIDQIKSTRGIDYHTKKSGFIVSDRQLKLNKEEMSNLAVSPGSVLAGDRKADKIIEKDKKEEHVIEEDKKGIKFSEDSKEDRKIEEDSTESVNSAMGAKDAQLIKEEDTRSQENAKKTGDGDVTLSEKSHKANTKEQVPPDKKESAGEEADTLQNNWATKQAPILEQKLEGRQNIMMKLKEKDDVVVLNALDFAGQGAYYASHQAHIRKDAIYIIVFDVSRSLTDRPTVDKKADKSKHLCDREHTSFSCWSQEDYIQYWLNMIQVHGGKCENMIFVGTHKDNKRSKFDQEYRIMMTNRHQDQLLAKIICDVCIDLSAEGEEELSKIKQYICNAVSESKRKSLPAKWMKYESYFEDIRSKKPVIGIDELLEIIDRKESKMWDREIHDMLRYFHENGNILYFSMDRLREIIILDIQWFVDCFKHIITDKEHAEESGFVNTEDREQWNWFLKIGLLDKRLYNKLLKAKALSLSEEHRERLGDYQQKLGMMLFMEDFELLKEKINGWYVPCVNTENFQPDSAKYENDEASSILCFRFDYLPQDLFGRMLVLCLSSEEWRRPLRRRLYKDGAHLLYCGKDCEGNGYHLEVYLFTTRQMITVQIVDKEIQQGKGTISERKYEELVKTEIQNIIRELLANFYACLKTCKIGFLCSKGEGYKQSSDQHFVSMDRKYCDDCEKFFGKEVNHASDFWNVSLSKDSISNKKDNGKGKEERQWILVCCHAYWTIRKEILLEFGTFYKSLMPEKVSTATTAEDSYLTKDQEAKLEILDSFVNIGMKLQHLCKTPEKSHGKKEENIAEIKDIAYDLKKISLAFGDDKRRVRRNLFFSWTDNDDDIRHEDIPAMPEISLPVPNLDFGVDVKLEASADVDVNLFIWLKKNNTENRLEILRKEPTSSQKRSDSYELKNFSKEDEGQYQVVVATEQTVRRKIFQLPPGQYHDRPPAERCLLYCLLMVDDYTVKVKDEFHIKVYNAIRERYFTDLPVCEEITAPQNPEEIVHVENDVIKFKSDDIRHDVMYAFITDCLVKDTDLKFFLETASRDMISEYCRSRDYERSEGERCLYIPRDMYDLFIDRLQLDILTHCIVSDRMIHDRISERLHIPKEVISWSDDAKRRFLANFQNGSIEMFRARGMIVGCAGAGKTTILRRLQRHQTEYLKKETETTVGLEVYNDMFEIISDKLEDFKSGNDDNTTSLHENKKLISMIDFAGQVAYYACHQIYLSRRAFYLLVIDMSKNLKAKAYSPKRHNPTGSLFENWTYEKYFVFWLQSIKTYCDDKKKREKDGEGATANPVIIIASHRDKSKGKKVRNQFYKELDECLPKGQTLKSHISPERYFEVECPKGNLSENQKDIIDSVRKCIVKTATSLPHWGEKIPTQWSYFEEIVNKQKDKKVLSRADLWGNDLIQFANEDDMDDMLRFYQEIGQIIYFSDEGLRDVIILDVQWFVDAFKIIITDPTHVEDLCVRRKDWEAFMKTGLLSEATLDKIWEEKNKSYVKHKETIMPYMEKLGLLAEVKYQKEKRQAESGDIAYYIPSINKKDLENEDKEMIEAGNKTPVLLFYFSCFLPHFFFYRLVVNCLQKWKSLRDDLLFKNAAFYKEKGGNHYIALAVSKTSIQLQVFTPEKNIKLDEETTKRIRSVVEDMIKEITSTFHEQVECEKGFPCKDLGITEEDEDLFLREDEVDDLDTSCRTCPKHLKKHERHQIDIDIFLKYWHRTPNPNAPNTAQQCST